MLLDKHMKTFTNRAVGFAASLAVVLGSFAPIAAPFAHAAINIKLYPNTSCTASDQASFAANTDVCSKATGLGTDHAHHIAIFKPSDPASPFAVSASDNNGNQQASFQPNECGTWTASVIKDSDSSVDNSVTFAVTGCLPANAAPVANGFSMSADQDTATSSTLSATDSDAGDTWTFATTSDPLHGVLSPFDALTGAFTYTPSAGYAGSDSFNFVAIDNHGATSSAATVAITVAPASAASICSDGIDNDEDGLVDGNDPGCSGSEDNDEADPAAPGQPTLATIVVTGDTAAGENQPGWLFNRDTSTETPFSFVSGHASIGTGSLYVPSITNTVNGPSDKFVGELFLLEPLANINSISYDFNIASTSAADAGQFYMSVYANFGESAPTKFYDCRYDVVPAIGVVNGYTTVTFDPTQAYPVATRGGATPSPHACPASPSGMDALSTGSSTLRVISLNVGDTSGSDLGVSGYLDNVVINKNTDTNITTYDFEPAPVADVPTDTGDQEQSTTTASSRRNGGNGRILGVATGPGEVKGAETGPECSEYLSGYIKPDADNDAGEVAKLQTFLNTFEGDTLAVTGAYDGPTLAAVRAFQGKYASDILTPWNLNAPTGWVYYTTKKQINTIYCNSQKDFPLSQAQLDEIAALKARQDSSSGGQGVTGSTGSGATSSAIGKVVLPKTHMDENAAIGADGKPQTAAAANASSTPGWFGKFVNWLFGK